MHGLFAVFDTKTSPKIHMKGLLGATANGNISPGTAAAESAELKANRQRARQRRGTPCPLAQPAGTPSGAASKWDIREKVWEHLEASGLAEFPRPVHGRIPNFKVRRWAASSCRSFPHPPRVPPALQPAAQAGRGPQFPPVPPQLPGPAPRSPRRKENKTTW